MQATGKSSVSTAAPALPQFVFCRVAPDDDDVLPKSASVPPSPMRVPVQSDSVELQWPGKPRPGDPTDLPAYTKLVRARVKASLANEIRADSVKGVLIKYAAKTWHAADAARELQQAALHLARQTRELQQQALHLARQTPGPADPAPMSAATLALWHADTADDVNVHPLQPLRAASDEYIY